MSAHITMLRSTLGQGFKVLSSSVVTEAEKRVVMGLGTSMSHRMTSTSAVGGSKVVGLGASVRMMNMPCSFAAAPVGTLVTKAVPASSQQEHKNVLRMGGVRHIGGGVPPEFGQPKSGGTAFLGTPANHMELVHRRPISPDIFTVDGKPTPWLLHYKMPLAAISSITNRVSGVILSAAVLGGGTIHAATGSLPAVASALGSVSIIAFPFKVGLVFPFVYHYLAAARHYYWDYTKGATIDNQGMWNTSAAIFAASVAGTAVIVGM
ncbi:hypothetical protein PPROV_000259100 [Pycnococcus provasolii]|uniref:Uncharacterized protein n=1 Tax=Pycnococcus provasolii TaxID=41880 RepID=A0A830HFF8_9CHLO|nr:hypothetical protein PPROV_000259100 [Pycnococcus provasolii]|mmetsp:Transcript_11168/g.25159  ORF Transcript_11168/g.25159 Transcript_11168/m.25159 type:complete len:264 (-) Transcript_11168:456-1247(-)